MNVLSLPIFILDLSAKYPDTWSDLFEEEELKQRTSYYEGLREDLFVLVNESIDTEIKRVEALQKTESDPDELEKLCNRLVWARISKADMYFLKAKEDTTPGRVTGKYKTAIEQCPQQFKVSTAFGGLRIFSELGSK